MQKFLVVFFFLLIINEINAQEFLYYCVDLNAVSYEKNGNIYIKNFSNNKQKIIRIDSLKYDFVTTYGNGLFIQLRNKDSNEYYLFTNEMECIGVTSNYFGGNIGDRIGYPDSDRRYVTDRVSCYSFDAAIISDFEINIYYPFSIAIASDKNEQEFVKYYDWYKKQISDDIINVTYEDIQKMDNKSRHANLNKITKFLNTNKFKSALIDFIAFYGINDRTSSYIMNIIKTYGLDIDVLKNTIRILQGFKNEIKSDENRAWVLFDYNDTKYSNCRQKLYKKLS